MKKSVFSAVILACSLYACAQDAAEKKPAPIRIILQFNEALTPDSGTLLQALQDRSRAQVQYVAAVSNNTYVYRFQPPAGLGYAQMIENLSKMPGVVRVETDQKVLPP